MTNRNLPDDFFAQKVVRYLLILQLVVLLPVVIISFTKFAPVALFITSLILLVFLSVLAWLYARFQVFPIVKEKQKLQREINEVKSRIQTEDARITKAQQVRNNLFHSETHELAAALKDIQTKYINSGLSKTLIANALIPGIGPKLKERLVAHNIHSAGDIHLNAVTRIEGFGTAKTQAVLGWRNVIGAQLETAKPIALPFGLENEIKQIFQARHTENNILEQEAQDKKINLEFELRNLLSALDLFKDITLRNFALRVFSTKGWTAGVVVAVLIISQICLGTSALAGTIAVSIPTATATQSVEVVSLQTIVAQTVIADLTQSAPIITLTAPLTTQTAVPIFASTMEANSASPIAPVLSSGNLLILHVIDVGQGDAILIQTPDGKTILIDGGEASSGVIQYLQSLGVNNIDVMIATHPHADHIGGLVQVLGAMPVQKVITNGEPHTTSTYEQFLDGIATAKAEYVEVKRGDVISVGSINFLVLNPVGITNSDLNENSIVLQFTYGKTTFLLMGDSGADTEKDLLTSGLPLKANILKVGHHASKSGSTPAFLSVVNAEVAIYSAGINNSYGHPAPQTISALSAVGATIYGTDQQGTIVVTVDENGYIINTTEGEIVAPPVLIPTATNQPQVSNQLEILSVTSPVFAGANATLKAKTLPSANCAITVYYKSGPSQAQGLDPKTANANGDVSWSWKVGSRTTPGNWSIEVTCNGVTKNTSFTVQ